MSDGIDQKIFEQILQVRTDTGMEGIIKRIPKDRVFDYIDKIREGFYSNQYNSTQLNSMLLALVCLSNQHYYMAGVSLQALASDNKIIFLSDQNRYTLSQNMKNPQNTSRNCAKR